MQSIADFAARYIEHPYEWGSVDAGPVAGFRRAVEGGGTAEEIAARVWAWAEEDFRAAEQAFHEGRLTHLAVNVC